MANGDLGQEFTAALHHALADQEHQALPYLFVGSGISRRYLGMPDWEGLLRLFADDAGENFAYHLASANDDLPKAASSIARAFHERWWTAPEYQAQRDEFGGTVRDELGALKVAIASYIVQHQELVVGRPGVDDVALSDEVRLLREVIVDGVITTNYDSLTDQIFPTFPPYIGQDELLLSDAQFIAETYKIHGSATRPLSLVLTHEDYDAFSKRDHYLAAKLLTIFAEHPVIFVGYSLTDKYIGEILDNITTAVGPDRIDKLSKRIFFVEWNSDPSFESTIEQTSIVRAQARLPITRVETHSFAPVWRALTMLDRPFPSAVLRELRKYVYDLVTTPDPEQTRETVRAIPIDSDEAGDYRVVFGVGLFSEKDLEDLSQISGRALTRDDVEQDVLGVRKRGLDAENALRYGIPDSIRPTARDHLPVFKYLAETGRLAADGTVDYEGLPDIIETLANKPLSVGSSSTSRFKKQVKSKLKTPRAIVDSSYSMYFKLDCLVLLDPANFVAQELGDVLVELYEDKDAKANISGFRKALCQFDRLKALELVQDAAST